MWFEDCCNCTSDRLEIAGINADGGRRQLWRLRRNVAWGRRLRQTFIHSWVQVKKVESFVLSFFGLICFVAAILKKQFYFGKPAPGSSIRPMPS